MDQNINKPVDNYSGYLAPDPQKVDVDAVIYVNSVRNKSQINENICTILFLCNINCLNFSCEFESRS
jgi:hypothetical protein